MNITEAIEKLGATPEILRKKVLIDLMREKGYSPAIREYLEMWEMFDRSTPAGIVAQAAQDGDREAFHCLIGKYPDAAENLVIIPDN